MLIVCESVDGGGKTTFVRDVVEAYERGRADAGVPARVHVLKFGRPAPGLTPMEEYARPLVTVPVSAAVHSPDRLVICDRLHVGEAVYGPTYRGENRIGPGGLLFMELLLESLGALRLLVQPDDHRVIEKRLAERGDDYLRLEDAERVWRWYEDYARCYRYRRAQLPAPGHEDVIRLEEDGRMIHTPALALAHARTRAASHAHLGRWPGYVGSWLPRALLVGDRRNPAARWPWTPLPFVPYRRRGSADHLLDALALLGETGRVDDVAGSVGLVNAGDDDPRASPWRDRPDAFHELHDELGAPRVVALGNEASRALARLGVAHDRVRHPQWARRFRAHDLAGYAGELGGAVNGA